MPVCSCCGEDNPARFRFCGVCGTALAASTGSRREERKRVSVLFCDLVGFTSRSERLDVEDVRGLLALYYVAAGDRRGRPATRRAGGAGAVARRGCGTRRGPGGRPDRADREGWPAGLYLAALSLQAGAPGPTRVETFTGEDRLVADYFRFELLSRLPEAEARFLLHTSVLDRMRGGLCDAVLETRQSAQTLQALERSNRFVVPLDRRGEWYRYHHLFGQLLRNELERSDPEAVAELNRRAMAWCMANNLAEEAVRYGHAAGETAYRGRPGRPAGPLLATAVWRPWRSGWLVRPRRAGAVPHARPLRRLGSRVDRAPG